MIKEGDDTYSSLKVLHHPKRLDALRRGEAMPPLRVQLVPTNRCNQRCQSCAYRLKDYTTSQTFKSTEEIPYEKLVQIVSDCKSLGVKAIEITGGGEPTVHPHFLDLCQLVLKADIDLGVVTNGVRWSPKYSQVLSGASWVRFSLDAGCSKTYAEYRESSRMTYDRVRKNLRDLVMHRGNSGLLVGVGFVVTGQNWSEVRGAAARARDDGADNMRISALFQNEGVEYFKNFYREAREICIEAVSLSTENFQVFNQFGDRLSDLEDASPDYSFCGYSKLTTYIGADCCAYACCNTAYNSLGLLGSFKDRTFRDFWLSREATTILHNLDATKCPRCLYNNKNRVINYLLSTNPKHVNFI
ncbi:hypothetical protein LCGC14_1117300 [marine sediment metagenome]|uniref:Radical SAM core domain-containing protein n=1 Tax=marine sediment metagenome TaxID=412755 RepID=A0A0F9PN47_9ZZZZ